MQDLVRIRVADPAEHVRIGQSALQRMIPDGQAAREFFERCGHDIDSAGIECGQPRLARSHMQRRALLRSGLGQREAAVVEQERGQGAAAVGLLGFLAPVQASGDHQVQHQPDVVIEADRDAFADAPERSNLVPHARVTGGSMVRSRKGPAIWACVSVWPEIRCSSASM